jgi:hypothetical protein
MSSPEQAQAAMIRNLAEKTGKTLEQWIAIARKSGREKHGEVVKFLKDEHGLTHGYANLVVHLLKGGGALPAAAAAETEGDAVAQQYAGGKASLRPIYDAVIRTVQSFGGDVEIAPKKAYVSLRRSKQFAVVQPSTKDRVDLGLQLKGVAPAGRLEPSGGFNSMVSHRVRLADAREVDHEVRDWLRRAYDAS